MSQEDVDKLLELDRELSETIDRIAETRAPRDAVFGLIDSLGSKGVDSEIPQPFVMNGQSKEINMKPSAKPRLYKFTAWKWAMIAGTAAALVLMLGLVFSTNQTSVFAKMQKELSEFNTLQFSSEIFLDDNQNPARSSVTYIQEPDLCRDEQNFIELGNPVDVFDFATGRYAKLSTSLKKAAVGSVSEEYQAQFRKLMDAFVGILRNADADQTDEVRRFEEDGLWYVEYEYEANITDAGPFLVNVIVNEQDALPVEITFFSLEGDLQRRISDIVFNEPIDPEMFSTEAPEDYEVVEMDIK